MCRRGGGGGAPNGLIVKNKVFFNCGACSFYMSISTNFSPLSSVQILLIPACCLLCVQGGTTPETNEIVTNICSCHNIFPLSSVQILFIPACCLLCVL